MNVLRKQLDNQTKLQLSAAAFLLDHSQIVWFDLCDSFLGFVKGHIDEIGLSGLLYNLAESILYSNVFFGRSLNVASSVSLSKGQYLISRDLYI